MGQPLPDPKEVEIRPFHELSDFGDVMPPEVAEAEERMHKGPAGRCSFVLQVSRTPVCGAMV